MLDSFEVVVVEFEIEVKYCIELWTLKAWNIQ